jgi:dienelactone hydrolase
MLLAGADDVAPGDACEELVQGSAWPDRVKILLFSGAQHAFDVTDLPPTMAYRGATIGHDPKSAAAAQRAIEEFLGAGD